MLLWAVALFAVQAIATDLPHCLPSDYATSYGPCEAGTRRMTWHKHPRHPLVHCQGEETIEGFTVPCNCDLDEYLPEIDSTCHNGVQKLTRWHEDGEGCTADKEVAAALPTGNVNCSCKAADVGSSYGECELSGGEAITPTRPLVFFWKKAGCRPGELEEVVVKKEKGVDFIIYVTEPTVTNVSYIQLTSAGKPVLRETAPTHTTLEQFVGQELVMVEGVDFDRSDLAKYTFPDKDSITLTFLINLPATQQVSCSQACGMDTFLAPPYSDCVYCPPGTYSINGKVYSAPWKDWPDNFNPTCTEEQSCASWKLKGDYIESGENYRFPRGSISVLTMWVDIEVLPSYLNITFLHFGFGHFQVVIDSSVALWYSGGSLVEGEEPKWITRTLDLSEEGVGCRVTLNVTHPDKWADGTAMGKERSMCVWENVFKPYKKELDFSVADNGIEAEFILAENSGCQEDDYDEGNYKGKIALIKRGNCSFVTKVKAAQAAGAAGIIVINREAKYIRMAGSSTDLNIPAAFISSEAGKGLLKLLEEGSVVTGSISRTHRVSLGKAEIIFVNQHYRGILPPSVTRIREVVLDGTVLAPPSCLPCPTGTFSPGGNINPEIDGCEVCPSGTIAPGTGNSECTECPKGTTSLRGTGKCVKEILCTAEDYVPKLGVCSLVPCKDDSEEGCHEGKKAAAEVTWESHQCKLQESTLPESFTILCGVGSQFDCAGPGKYHVNRTSCAACPPHMVPILDEAPVSFSEEDNCRKCKEDEVVLNVVDLQDGFAGWGGQLPQEWSTSCSGDDDRCAQIKGWELLSRVDTKKALPYTSLRAGRHTRDLASITLELTYRFELEVAGNFTFHLATDVKDTDHQKLIFKITDVGNDKQPLLVQARDFFNHTGKHTVHLPIGAYEASWEFLRLGKGDQAVFELLGVYVEGAAKGSPWRCIPCPPGMTCSNGIPSPCPPDSVRPAKAAASQCNPCVRSVPNAKQTECVPCSDGLEVREIAGTSECAVPNHRKLYIGEHTYDLGKIEEFQYENYHINLVGVVKGVKAQNVGYVVQVMQDGSTKSYGSHLEVNATDSGLVFDITGGDKCTENPGEQLRATIQFSCNKLRNQLGEAVTPTFVSNCYLTLNIQHSAGCPLCGPHSPSYLTPCKDGKRMRVRSTIGCLGTEDPEVLMCGEKAARSSQRWLIAVLVAAALFVVAAAAFAVHTYRKHTEIRTRYRHLSTNDADQPDPASPDGALFEDGSSPAGQEPYHESPPNDEPEVV